MNEIQKQTLAHIYWIGGSPCAGKSAIAQTLAERFGYHYYPCDHQVERHQALATPETHPIFHHLNTLRGDALWLRPLETQVTEEIQYCDQHFDLILADLLTLPKDKPILAEGAALLPTCVIPLLTHAHQAIWLVPSEAFQRHHYAQRPWVHDVLADCTDPAQAFENWMQRDARFALWVAEQARLLGGRCLTITGEWTMAETIDRVADYTKMTHLVS